MISKQTLFANVSLSLAAGPVIGMTAHRLTRFHSRACLLEGREEATPLAAALDDLARACVNACV